MAYIGGNPDALPAHAEPEQAAQILSSQQQRRTSAPRPPPDVNTTQPYSAQTAYQTKPQSSSQAYNSPQPNTYYNPSSQNLYQNPPPRNTYQNKPQPPAPQQLHPQSLNHPPSNGPSPNYNYGVASPPPNSYGSPPPQNYGFGPPPQRPHGRSPPLSRPPPTPAPGPQNGSDASLFPLFKAVDKTGTGQLGERELGNALVNGDYTHFDPHTVKMMIRMFDVDKSGTIGFDEFCGLWGFLAAWRQLFDRFDEDHSGTISIDEYTKALVAFGYRLSGAFVSLLYRTYDKGGRNEMSFDLFVQSCIILKRMTDVFKKYDDDRDGFITLSFEEFLTEILRQR